MDVLNFTRTPPTLHRPVLLAGFEGWNDAGESASGAVEALRRQLEATRFADIDPEEFFDFQAVRPVIHSAKGGGRRLEWPRNRFLWTPLPGGDRDLVLLSGTEPNLRWRAFTRTIIKLAKDLGVELVVTLGGLQVDVPHTRPMPVTGSASDPDLAERLGLRRSSYEGPTGITGVLQQECAAAGLPVVSLWTGVPHYLAGASYAAGALTLAESVLKLLEVDLPLDRLVRDAAEQRADIAHLVADDEDLAEYVADLEERIDERPVIEFDQGEELPAPTVTGDELAAEFERYLRGRGD